MKTAFTTRRLYTGPGKNQTLSGDFVCLNCHTFVSAEVALSGVRNRNHCPSCLASRHLDQFEAGDRLSACKGRMQAVGLTFKRITKKYAGNQPGELMLVHLCDGCGKVSINRIAADDNPDMILAVLGTSADLDVDTRELLDQEGITLLIPDQMELVQQLLFGSVYEMA